MTKIRFILVLLILSTLSSCSFDTISYHFIVKNETEYFLSNIKFDWCNSDNNFQLYPYAQTDKFVLEYQTSLGNIVANGSICTTVTEYSDSISTYTNTIGIAIDRLRLSENEVNVIHIVISSEPHSKTDIFDFVLE